MSARTTTRKSRTTVSLREDVRSRPAAVDEAGGVIRGVKVLGLVSENGRRYLPEAVRAAAPMYEGVGVFLDHPARPRESRSARDRIGWLENVRVAPDGLFADLHLLTSDRDAAKILEAARKRPELFGLSHNAEGRGRQEGGVFVVEEIVEVRSVDLVADPATNKSLFEGKTVPRITLAELIKKSPAKSLPALRRLLEAYEDAGDMEVDEPAAGAEPDELDHLFQAFKKCMDDDPEKAKKILALLKPEAQEVDTEEGGDEGEGGQEDEKSKDAKEGKKPSAAKPGEIRLSEERAKAICKTAGVEATADVLEAVRGASFDQALAVINLAKRSAAPPRHTPTPPRSASRQAVSEGTAPSAGDAKGWATKLLG